MRDISIREYIIYEDRDIIVLHKPAGIAVQRAGFGSMDIEHMLLNYLADNDVRERPYVGIVNRLDQPVEGIVLIGKTPAATANLNKQSQNHTMEKKYLAIVEGVPKETEGKLIDYLVRDGRQNISKVVGQENSQGKKSVLEYRVLKQQGDRSLLEITLHTGRHHQIRVQLAHMGCPIVGDQKYGNGLSKEPLELCAYLLKFMHPVRDEQMVYEVEGNIIGRWNVFNTV